MKAIKWSLFVIAVFASNYSAFAGETTSHKDDKNVVEVPWVSTRDVPVTIMADHGEDRHGRNIFDLAANDNDLGQAGIEAGVYGSWRHDGKRAMEPRPVWCE